MFNFRIDQSEPITKNLLQILDVLGRETTFKPNTPLIYVYDDGSIEDFSCGVLDRNFIETLKKLHLFFLGENAF